MLEEIRYHHHGVGVLIACEEAGSFLFQRKDDRHPDPRCRDRYSLWGGVVKDEDGIDEERYYRALCRELHEEWCHQLSADYVCKALWGQVPKFFTLSSNGGTGHPYRYRYATFSLLIPNIFYLDIISNLERHGYNEGMLTIMDRSSVEGLIADPDRHKEFLGGLHDVLAYYFRFEERFIR